MSGVDIVGAVLLADAGVLALVPASKIKAGGLPQGIKLPAISVTRVSRVGNAPLAGAGGRSTERVQVTVMAPDYDTQDQVLRQIATALDGRSGTVGGVAGAAITSLGGGPDFRDAEASIWSGSEDFRVSYPL